jgi:hypothetical protein
MIRPIKNLCLYTTIYPNAKEYLREWYRSTLEQTDSDFHLWIGLDALSVEEVTTYLGTEVKATWVIASCGDTPAQVRQRALERIADVHDGVILVDSDDVLHETRVAAAREDLQRSDLAGCALDLVDQGGKPLSMTMSLPPTSLPDEVFPRHNIFGLSNSAFRTELLRRCLPIPSEVVLVDWFLATRAWLYGARLMFDHVARMNYRQHDQNMAQIRPPFTEMQIRRDTIRVIQHLNVVKRTLGQEALVERVHSLDHVKRDIQRFHDRVVLRSSILKSYLELLNELDPTSVWWASVAHPSLRGMWT